MKTSIFLLFAGTSTVILMQAATGYEFTDVASKRGDIMPKFSAKKLTGETLYYVPPTPPKPAPKPEPKPEVKIAPKPTPTPKVEPKPEPKIVAQPKPPVAAPAPVPVPKAVVKSTPEQPTKKGGLFGLFSKSKGDQKAPESKPEAKKAPAKPVVEAKPEPKPVKELAKAEPKPAPVPAPAPPPPPVKKPEPKPEVAKDEAKPEGKSGLRRFFGLGKDKNEQPKAELKPKEIAKVENKPSKPEAKLPPPPKEMKPIVSQTAEVVTKKKTPPPLIAAPEPKKPGFFARLLGKKSDKISEESAVDADDRPQKPADWESKYIVSDDNVKFFAYGPSQAIDSDERLSKGTVVSLKKGGKAWAEISLESGRVVTVGADQIRPAKLSDFAPPPVAIAATRGPSSDVYYEPAPPPNLPDASNAGTIDFPELLLPPLPPQ